MSNGEIRRWLDAGKPRVAAAFYIAAVCYPFDQAGTDKYLKAQRAYVAKKMRDQDEIYVDDDSRLMETKTMMRTLKKTAKILRARFDAVESVALPVLFKQTESMAIRVSPTAPSPHAAMQTYFAWKSKHKDAANQRTDAENYRQRTWKKTLPVVHLAHAMLYIVDWKSLQDKGDSSLAGLIFNPEWVEPALKNANGLIPHLMRANIVKPGEDLVVFDDEITL